VKVSNGRDGKQTKGVSVQVDSFSCSKRHNPFRCTVYLDRNNILYLVELMIFAIEECSCRISGVLMVFMFLSESF
jgi:hypothetical protein